MGVILVPTRRDDILLSSVYVVTDVADILKKNWPSYCFNELVKCICNHNADGKKYIPGCLLFLELIFLEHTNGIFHTIDGCLDFMSWGSGDVELLFTKLISSSSRKRSSEDASLKSPPRKWEKRDGKRHKTDWDELCLYERIDAWFSTMEARFDNFSQEFKVAMGDGASRDEELMGRVMKMENEFRAFRDEIGTAVKSIIKAVKATTGDPLSREQLTELKKNDQKDAADNVKASAAVLLSTEQLIREEKGNQKGEVEKPSEPISPTSECVKTHGLGVKNWGEAEGEIVDDSCSESPSVKVVKKSPCKQAKASKVEKFILLSDESVAANDGCAKTL